MTNVHEIEEESDEDCEIYFLKPVNEYNIVDKIKEANKELFSNYLENNNEVVLTAQVNRKVSFAANLEEYEPQNVINLNELHGNLDQDSFGKNYKNSSKLREIEKKLHVITEEVAINESEIKNSIEIISQKEEQSPIDMNIRESVNDLKETVAEHEYSTKDENLAEICEEILIMDIKNDKCIAPIETKFDSSGAVQRKISKQITFDYGEENEEELNNKSLTNLLISDNEVDSDEKEDANQEYNCNESINEDTDNEDYNVASINNEYYEEDEDDDKLSIIVASYLPNDTRTAYDKTSLSSSSIKCSPRITKSRKLTFNKRFSFRHKTIASISKHCSSINHPFTTPPEVTDLKLHYKTCCEYKNAQQKLPKYTGYLSEYGLSREQLIERERKLQEKQRTKTNGSLKSSEAGMHKVHDNEKAFTTWLKNKIRFPINKTRNMFDVKRPLGLKKFKSVGGNTVLNDSVQILHTTKYRSINAKFRNNNNNNNL